MSQQNLNPRRNQVAQPSHAPLSDAPSSAEVGVSVDGFGQVLAMLQSADDAFRNSILRRIAQRDRDLALRLHRALNEF